MTAASASLRSVAIRCEAVTKHYGSGETRIAALRGVDLAIDEGCMTMLVGPSGCGKTTLISILSGILSQSSGELSVFGTDPSRLPDGDRAEWRAATVGFVFQQFNLLPTLTAAENAAVPLLIRGTPWPDAVEIACGHLSELGMAERCGSLPRELSGGQQQRIAIARALVHDPRLLVCDEPTSALDHETGERVIDVLRAAALRSGRAVIVVTHDQRILRHADTILRMDDGRIIVEPVSDAIPPAHGA
ncbi:MAG: ABC transporter ATP-binding protein [Phycisphaerales bacterium]|nr:ABC transporter ATP-binding protein [Phycisphaerales bacterium]